MAADSPARRRIRSSIARPAAVAVRPISRPPLRLRYSDRPFLDQHPLPSPARGEGREGVPEIGGSPHSGPNACLLVAQPKPFRLLDFRAEMQCSAPTLPSPGGGG